MAGGKSDHVICLKDRNMVAEAMARRWAEPVFVQVDMRSPEIIHNPAEALAFLANSWAGSRRKHEYAREVCSAAISGHVSSEAAREAFVQAALDAKIVTCAPNTHK